MPLARGVLKFLYRMIRETDRQNGRLEEFKDGATGGTLFQVQAYTVYYRFSPRVMTVAVWCSGNALVLINAVALHRARLVLGWVTAFG